MEIKFRGEDRRTGGFVYGDLIQPRGEGETYPTIRSGVEEYHEVEADSVRQFLGVDGDGVEMYEGDIITLGAGGQYGVEKDVILRGEHGHKFSLPSGLGGLQRPKHFPAWVDGVI